MGEKGEGQAGGGVQEEGRKRKRREEMMRKGELRERKEIGKWRKWRQSQGRKISREGMRMPEKGMVTPLHRKRRKKEGEGMKLLTQKMKMTLHQKRKARRKGMTVRRRIQEERAKNLRRK